MLVAIFITMLVIVLAIIVGFWIMITRVLKERNPNKCYVFPFYENTLNKPQKGRKVEKTDNGIRYAVKGKYIDVPTFYPIIWFKNRRTFFTDINNNLITSFDKPLLQKFKLSAGNKDDLQYELGTSNLVSEAVKAFKGKNDAMLMLIAIIIFAVGGVLGFAVGKMTTQPKTITQVVTVNATQPQQPYIIQPQGGK